MSLNLRLGFLFNLCFAHLAGGINLKNGGNKGLVNFSRERLNPNSKDLNFEDLTPYSFLNSSGSVESSKRYKAYRFYMFRTGPSEIISCTSFATSVSEDSSYLYFFNYPF